MFDIGFTEILLIGVVALIVVGPERLPGLIRTTLGYIRQFKASFSQIKSDVERELDLADLKKDLADSKANVSKMVGYDDLHESLDDLRKESENLRDIADDGYEHANSPQNKSKDDYVADEKITQDLQQLSDSQTANLPDPDSEMQTGVEKEITPEKTKKSG